jgi:outer membrane protein assembly factor BamB
MAMLIIFLMAIPISASLLTVNAHNTSTDKTVWTITSYAYLNVAPNPVGVGQTVDVCMWVDAPMPSAAIENDIRRHDYSLTITKPDGTTETKTWNIISDTTGVQFYQYTPTQVGNYTFFFNYPQQTYTWNNTYLNDIYLGSNRTKILTVQQDPIPMPISSYPLPSEYWTRPIEGQNSDWYTIASNWLGAPFIVGAGSAYIGGQQTGGSGPTSAHIMWTKPIQYGGVVGGNNTAVPGEGFYEGLSYNTRFSNQIIMQGTLFYQEPYGNSGTGGDYVAVDLRTGQQLWRINASATGVSLVPSFGYLYSFESPNQHGVLPNGLLIATTTAYSGLGTVWRAYDPRTGVLTTMNITNVPSGQDIAGPSGEILRYQLVNVGSTASPKYNLLQWNSSKVIGIISGTGVGNWYSGTVNASLPAAYDWNVSLTDLPKGTWTIGTAGRGIVPLANLDDKILLTQGTFGGHVGDMGATVSVDPANITAISLKLNTLGNVSWTKSYPQAEGNNTRYLSAWDPANRVFIFSDKESFANYGYSLDTGEKLWGPSYPPETNSVDWNFMIWYTPVCYQGRLYSDGFSGLLYCWDDKTGELLWTYGNGGAGNSTASGFVTPYGYYPEFVECVADGKLYIVGNEHSPNSPMYKDSQLRCINASNGAELWTIMGWGNVMSGAVGAVADGYLTVFNPYDGQLYSYGKGPSDLTLEITNDVITSGSSIMIKGTVTDIAAGTKQNEQAARFPHGVPAVADASQGAWMQYVYMQKPRPTNVTGVPVTMNVVDSNGNYREIGTTTTNDGFFSLNWKPDIEGQYTVYASFAGSNSYYPSHAVTSFAVDPAAPTPTPQAQIQLPPTEMYFTFSTAAIIAAIAIVGAVMILMLKKRA